MTAVLGLYLRFRQLIHEAAKFGVVGVLGVLVNLAGADLLRYDAGMGKYTALTIATIIAMIGSYFGNRYWTFRHRQSRGTAHETTMFFALNGVALLIQYAVLWIIDDGLGLDDKLWYTLAVFLGIGLGTLFRFWSYRKWVWHAPAAAAEVTGPGPAAGVRVAAVTAGPYPAPVGPVSPAGWSGPDPAAALARPAPGPPRWTGPKHARPGRSRREAPLAGAGGQPR